MSDDRTRTDDERFSAVSKVLDEDRDFAVERLRWDPQKPYWNRRLEEIEAARSDLAHLWGASTAGRSVYLDEKELAQHRDDMRWEQEETHRERSDR